ncbi:nuclease-related domain-containing protein [Streptomyces sp. NPDC093589]|uniref:nuclease-related domain-containing protein n=1 Tax=Streptomyces sp. NPDC093589 TaxID=3366043 RepID=UPI0038191467
MAQGRRLAARRRSGAEGERRTARLTAPLDRSGWFSLHDRKIPGMGRANLDHLWISPCAKVFAGDSKRWDVRRGEVAVVGGRLMCGTWDVDRQVGTALKETASVSRLLGVPVTLVMPVHGAQVRGGGFEVRGAYVFPAARLLELLRHNADGAARPREARRLAQLAEAQLPQYVK